MAREEIKEQIEIVKEVKIVCDFCGKHSTNQSTNQSEIKQCYSCKKDTCIDCGIVDFHLPRIATRFNKDGIPYGWSFSLNPEEIIYCDKCYLDKKKSEQKRKIENKESLMPWYYGINKTT